MPLRSSWSDCVKPYPAWWASGATLRLWLSEFGIVSLSVSVTLIHTAYVPSSHENDEDLFSLLVMRIHFSYGVKFCLVDLLILDPVIYILRVRSCYTHLYLYFGSNSKMKMKPMIIVLWGMWWLELDEFGLCCCLLHLCSNQLALGKSKKDVQSWGGLSLSWNFSFIF